MSVLDQAKAIREGEELDVGAIADYLQQQIEGLEGALRISQFPGGASNLTYLLEFDNRSFVLRRPPFGKKAKSAHDMGREFTVMQGLQERYPYVPKMVAFCQDEQIIGSEFYVMERLQGIILRTDLPKGLDLEPSKLTHLCHSMLDRLVELHQLDWQSTSLKSLCREGDFVERQLKGWSDRYQKARTDDVPSYSQVIQWLEKNRPGQIRQCLVHNDYRFDNLVLQADDPGKIIGVLDWEMATIGDPLMDLGNSLAYWIEANDPPPLQIMRRQPTHLPGMLSRKELVSYYLDKAGLEIDNFDFYAVFGIFRLVAIIQQIYYRYYHGQTQDKRFAGFGQMVNFLDGYLQNMIGQSA